MNEIRNPHDAFFKNRFSRLTTARAFCRYYLPPAIPALCDFDGLEVIKDSFTDEQLQEHFSDVLYRVPLRNGGAFTICILLEHKSYPDAWVAWQIERYRMRVWTWAREEKCDKLPAIVPVVVYHGKEAWNVPEHFSALFNLNGDLEILRPFLPEFRYHLVDLSRYTDAEIVGGPELEPALGVLRHIFRKDLPERLEGFIQRAAGLRPVTIAKDFIETLVRYVIASKQVEEVTVSETVNRALIKGEDEIWLPVIDDWKLTGFLEGRQEGRVQGRQEGRQEGEYAASTRIALALLQHRFQVMDASLEDKIKALSAERLAELSVAALDFRSPGDVAKWLRKQSAKPKRKTRK